ncbi:hypothetical protein ACFL0Q_06445 [Thermodesulfobacteriota bacterium]
MGKTFPCELMEAPTELAEFDFCSEQVYRDLLACRKGDMSEAEFQKEYLTRAAILCLDMTGLTKAASELGKLQSLFRILDVQKVRGPVFRRFKSRRITAFADNMVATFDDAESALDAALHVHTCIRVFNDSTRSGEALPQCCIGIGYGDVYAIGVDEAMGDEMNRASKLGEDIARSAETLVTELAYDALKERSDVVFRRRAHDDYPFSFYEVLQKEMGL